MSALHLTGGALSAARVAPLNGSYFLLLLLLLLT
jgi:hypothetical protein